MSTDPNACAAGDVQRAVFAALAPFLTGRMHDAVRAHRGELDDATGTALVALQGLVISRVRAVRGAWDRGESADAALCLLAELARNWAAHPSYPADAVAAYIVPPS